MCIFRGFFGYIIIWINEQTQGLLIQYFLIVAQEKSSDMSPPKEVWEALPEETQAGELGEGVL